MYDNKVRLSRDVLEKAEQIAAEWGLKNARAAVEAVFRCYCNDYLQRQEMNPPLSLSVFPKRVVSPPSSGASQCDALDALDELLAL